MENLITKALMTEDLDAALVLLQDALGIKDGGLAGMMFSGMEVPWNLMPLDARTERLAEYLKMEAIYASPQMDLNREEEGWPCRS